MPGSSTRTPTPRALHCTISVVALCLLGSVLVTLSIVPASADSRGAGYRIPTTGKAAGGWIGARVLGRTKAYRLEPSASPKNSRYRAARVVANLDGGSHPSQRSTQRAAYILSVYGTRNDDIQAAAVDAAVLHLVAGGKWRIDRRQGSRRIRATDQPGYVRSYAKTMLSRSKRSAGPVKRSLRASATTVGSASRVVFTIRHARTGRGLGGLPVTFRYAGAAATTSYTNSDGRAVAFVTPQSPRSTVRASVGSVPEWRLHVRHPRKAPASAVAVAGRKLSLTSRARVAAAGAQVVSVSNAASVRSTGQTLAGRYSISGGDGTRSVTRRLRGPFTSTTSCTGAVAFTSATTVSETGAWALPPFAPSRSGYYRWTVAVGGNEYSTPATGCGAPVRVRKQANVSQFRRDGDTNDVPLDKKFRIGVRLSGFDRIEGHTLTSRLYGPFTTKQNAACRAARQVTGKTVTRTANTNGEFTMPPAVIGAKANVGWYVWRTNLNSGDLIIGDQSTCGIPFKVSE